MLKVLYTARDDVAGFLERRRFVLEDRSLAAEVSEIIEGVRTGGDLALCRFTSRFDGVELTPAALRVDENEIQKAYELVDGRFLEALRRAADNIISFHRRQLRNSWFDARPDGTVVGMLVRPLERVGIYVPGGTASYPSSVLMNALPARVAGVEEIVMVTPPRRDGSVDPHVLVAATECGVSEIYRVGGAQAVAALAYGTESIRRVDKITGPGNIYVTLAKRQVYGVVDIDMLAGPSEITIVAGPGADPRYVAADLLSQAEHDTRAWAVLVTPDRELAAGVEDEVARQLEALPRSDVAARALEENGAIIITGNLEEAFEIADRFAPEHLELIVDEPFRWLGKIRNAGAVFLGPYSPEPVGDYFAGPNHVLPTGGTARFYSLLNVDSFLKKISVVGYSREALAADGDKIVYLARVEGLEAHASAVLVRLADIGNVEDK